MFSAFGDFNEPQSAAFGPQKHRKLFFNPETLRWEPIEAEDEGAYDQAFAGNSARGAFHTFGTVQDAGPDTSTEQERSLLSPQGQPDFYSGSLGALRSLVGQQRAQQAKYTEEDRRAQEKKQRGY